jgi:hypothetical protein
MNKNLYDRKAKLPDSLIKHLNKCFNSVTANSNDEGYDRNRKLVSDKIATYQQIKRIKNWFDSYSGNKKDSSFILNGGDRMKKWCEEVLRVWRSNDKNSKETKSDAGMENQFLDNHEKNSFNLNDKHTKTTDNLKEDVDRINKLIKKII